MFSSILLSALKTLVTQGFQGLADRADSKWVKINIPSAKADRRTEGGQQIFAIVSCPPLSACGHLPKRKIRKPSKKQHKTTILYRGQQGGIPMTESEKIPLEKAIVNQIVHALKAAGVIWIIKTHGSPYQRAGVPDLLAIAPKSGRLVGIEVKRPKVGRATELQLKQIDAINRAGGVAGIATCAEEALRLIEAAEEVTQ